MRSSGAVTVLAAAPAMAPAEKRAASRGTTEKAARGCLRSWEGVGMKSWCSLDWVTETEANLEWVVAAA